MLQVAATGTAVSETDIFASSMCPCNIITWVHVKVLLVENIGHFDVEKDLSCSRGLGRHGSRQHQASAPFVTV